MWHIMLVCYQSHQFFESGIPVVSGVNEFLSLCGSDCPYQWARDDEGSGKPITRMLGVWIWLLLPARFLARLFFHHHRCNLVVGALQYMKVVVPGVWWMMAGSLPLAFLPEILSRLLGTVLW